jgi:hypothetical protein
MIEKILDKIHKILFNEPNKNEKIKPKFELSCETINQLNKAYKKINKIIKEIDNNSRSNVITLSKNSIIYKNFNIIDIFDKLIKKYDFINDKNVFVDCYYKDNKYELICYVDYNKYDMVIASSNDRGITWNHSIFESDDPRLYHELQEDFLEDCEFYVFIVNSIIFVYIFDDILYFNLEKDTWVYIDFDKKGKIKKYYLRSKRYNY